MIYMSETTKKELDYTLEFDDPSEAIDYYGLPPYDGPKSVYRIRELCALSEKLGRPLTDDEAKQFETGEYHNSSNR